MNEKNYKKRLDFQEKMISHKSEQIKLLESQIENLKLKIEEKTTENGTTFKAVPILGETNEE